MKNIRVAVVQIASRVFDREATITKLDQWAGKAAVEGAQLAVFPEGSADLWSEGDRVYLATFVEDLPRFETLLGADRIIVAARRGGKLLLVNR